MNFNLATAIAAPAAFLIALPGHTATFFSLNPDVFKFDGGTPESTLESSAAARVSFGDTTVYIGTNQVSSINQDPIVTSFTNGVRDWTQSYDTSGIDGRGVGLLYDEATANLYGVFTADGGSQGANTFGAATQGGWLSGFGSGGSAKVSVLLKLNPDTGNAEAGTFIRAQKQNGDTNSVGPTELDFVDGQVVFFGDSFFTPLDVDKQPFENGTDGLSSPFDYRVVLSEDLSEAISAEAIGWKGITAFSPLSEDGGTDDVSVPEEDDEVDAGGSEDEMNDSGSDTGSVGDDTDTDTDTDVNDNEDDVDEETDDTAGAGNEGSDDGSVDDPIDGDIANEIDTGEAPESIPEPGLLVGLLVALSGAVWQKRAFR